MSKQDRQGVRTPSDLERKYDLASLVGIKKSVENSVEGINKTNKTLEEFMTSTLKTIDDIYNQMDGNITTWFYSGVPTLSNVPASEWSTETLKKEHLGDLYYDQETGFAYRFSFCDEAYTWVKLLDNDVAEALALANSAQDTADSKRRVFVAQPAPPYDSGDLWFNNQEIYICQVSKALGETYADKDFIIATKYTDDTFATQVGDNLEIVRGTVTTIQEGVDAFKVDLETTVKTIDSLQQETIESIERMSYTFGTNDLHIAKSTDPVNTRINQQGLKVYTYNDLQAIFNHRGAGIQKLIVVGDAQLGNVSITKAKDNNGNDCTDINYLVSNVQTLSDLEGE
jgi:phage-related protein